MEGRKRMSLTQGGVEMSVFLSNYHGLPVRRNKWEKAPESKARAAAPCRIKFVLNVKRVLVTF